MIVAGEWPIEGRPIGGTEIGRGRRVPAGLLALRAREPSAMKWAVDLRHQIRRPLPRVCRRQLETRLADPVLELHPADLRHLRHPRPTIDLTANPRRVLAR